MTCTALQAFFCRITSMRKEVFSPLIENDDDNSVIELKNKTNTFNPRGNYF